MKVRELIQKSIDVDVYDNICEELGIAFVGPLHLTSEGRLEFSDVLELDVEVSDNYAIVQFNEDSWKSELSKACKFFNSAAGFCSVENYNKWFKEASV